MLNIKCHLKILPIKIEFSLFHRVSAKFKKYRKRGVPNRSVLARFSQSSQPTWTPTPLLTAFSARAVLTSSSTFATTTGMASRPASLAKPSAKSCSTCINATVPPLTVRPSRTSRLLTRALAYPIPRATCSSARQATVRRCRVCQTLRI